MVWLDGHREDPNREMTVALGLRDFGFLHPFVVGFSLSSPSGLEEISNTSGTAFTILDRVQGVRAFSSGSQVSSVGYLPAESDSGMCVGNSNWPVRFGCPWMFSSFGHCCNIFCTMENAFAIDCSTGSGQQMNLYQVADETTRRMSRIFLRDNDGRRPVYGGTRKFQEDAHWRDYTVINEYFHGDNGAGLGASHQTGWTGIIA